MRPTAGAGTCAGVARRVMRGYPQVMIIATEVPPARTPIGASQARLDVDAVETCDFCGRPVRRETVVKRVEHGDDGVEIVLVCPECDHGED